MKLNGKASLNFLFLFCLAMAFAQEKHDYIGGIILNDSISISYKLSITENKGMVKGYSITDLGGENETRSNIFGEYNKENKELSFRETGIVYTKSPVSQQDFCFINTTVKGFVFGKTNKAKTKFVGLFSDNTPCINGELFLSAAEKVEERINRVAKKISRSNKIADSVKQKINIVKMMDSLNMNVLRSNQILSVFSKSKKINLIIYDGGKEDGDKISITANGKTILKSYQANNFKRIVQLLLDNEKTEVVISADNEGSIAPNTIVVEIEDESNKIKALSNLKVGETTQIDILKTR